MDLVTPLRAALEEVADPERAQAMAAYMKDQFPFFGIGAATRRKAQRPILAQLKAAPEPGPAAVALAHACWDEPERELQYVATDALRAHAPSLTPEHLPDLRHLITTRSWWDTIDTLAAHTVGPLVAAHPHLAADMDAWVDDDNLWVARTAILHQLNYGDRTDPDRLFHYARQRAADTEFFIRKALGWALRQYARTDPDAVRAFVAAHEDTLSGLTKREARKHL